ENGTMHNMDRVHRWILQQQGKWGRPHPRKRARLNGRSFPEILILSNK
ncbi:hypothetical protein A2U01_0085340, partial [Trifolium medium]|nr:hypothetical protein [Trifolium medium]